MRKSEIEWEETGVEKPESPAFCERDDGNLVHCEVRRQPDHRYKNNVLLYSCLPGCGIFNPLINPSGYAHRAAPLPYSRNSP
jgi:hypothetical protein